MSKTITISNAERLILIKLVNAEYNKISNSTNTTIKNFERFIDLMEKLKR